MVRHSTLRNSSNVVTDENGVVDGYIKFRIMPGGDGGRPHTVQQRNLAASPMGIHHRTIPAATSTYIPGLPPGFGKKFTFDAMDSKLMKFCEYLEICQIWENIKRLMLNSRRRGHMCGKDAFAQNERVAG